MKPNELFPSIGRHEGTGLFHGLVYRNHPTPSGCDRLLLQFSSERGFTSARLAALGLARAMPDLKINPKTFSAESCDVSALDLTVGLEVDRICDKATREVFYEIGKSGYLTRKRPLDITEMQLERLVALGVIEEDSDSGDDPALHCFYQHYIVRKRIYPVRTYRTMEESA